MTKPWPRSSEAGETMECSDVASQFTEYSQQAGWSGVEQLPIEHTTPRFYRLIA